MATYWPDWDGVLGPLAMGYRDQIDANMKSDTRALFTYQAFPEGVASDSDRSLQQFAEQRRAYLLRHPDVQRAPDSTSLIPPVKAFP